MLTLDLIQTIAFGAIVLFVGYQVRRAIPILGRCNIPAPVIGGLIVATAVLIARQWDVTLLKFDTTLQQHFMIAFFTTIGFGASLGLLKRGGPQVMIFFALATLFAVLQNVLGAGLAWLLGEHPLFGVMCGSVTLTGGPATGLAFAPDFEAAGLTGAATIGVAAAMGGIVCGGLIGGPVGTFLVERHRLKKPAGEPHESAPPVAAEIVEQQLTEPADEAPAGEDKRSYALLKAVSIILVAMWLGSWVSHGFAVLSQAMIDLGYPRLAFKLPAYIGAMLVASVLRNFDDRTGWLGLSQQTIDDLGNVALAFFLVLALMTLELWKLAGAALPLVVILVAQVAMVALVCFWPLFQLMGRDYDAAIMGSGFCGFMLGTTANAMANMEALVDRYGPAPRAFLVVPMVGAFFVDFTNALIITGCLNFYR